MNIRKLLSVPRSLIYCCRLFGWGGVKLPILFSCNTRVVGIRKGAIEIEQPNKRVFIGYEGTKGIESFRNTKLIIGNRGKIVFKGKAFIGTGTTIRVDNGTCTFGDEFSCNTNCFISCTEKVTFGTNCLLGWGVNIRDSDGHSIICKGEKKPDLKPVNIGSNIWIAANVDILKGVTIGNGCVVGYRSCVTKPIVEENCLVAGYPGKIINRNISWTK